jgi:hypothetical protein
VIVPSYHYMVGPLAALLALGVLVLICRWVFSTSHRDDRTARRLAAARARGDYGLLVPVATVTAAEDGQSLRARLAEAGVRCTLAPGQQEGIWAVLVFRADAERARSLVLPG